LGYLEHAAPTNKGAAKDAAIRENDERPTYDQLYLASRLSPDNAPKARLSPAAIQRLNNRYGVTAVSDAMRLLHGFPPEIAVRSTYAYVEGICRRTL
jgi:hypothetical protein